MIQRLLKKLNISLYNFVLISQWEQSSLVTNSLSPRLFCNGSRFALVLITTSIHAKHKRIYVMF